MKKRFAIPLAVLGAMILWIIIFYAAGGEKTFGSAQSSTMREAAPAKAEEPEEAAGPITAVEEVTTQTIEPEQPVREPPKSPAVSENPLMRATLIEAPVVNGLGKRIGTRAYITLPQELLLEVVSMEDVAEFYLSFKGKGYNWVSVICPEGTGLVFAGDDSGMATYGTVDKTGRMDGPIHWTITYDETAGTFKELKF